MAFNKVVINKTDGDIESIKSSYQINFFNYYAKSSLFKKCCIDCSPNSSIYYDAKNKSNYLINVNDIKLGNHLHKSASKLNRKDLSSLVLENEKIKEFIELNLNCLNKNTDNLRPINHTVKSNFIKSIRGKILNIYATIDSDCTNNKYSFKIFKWLTSCLFDKIFFSQTHLSALETASKKNLPLVYVTTSDSTLFDKLIIQLVVYLNKLQLPYLLTSVKKASILNTLSVKYFDDTKLENFFKHKSSDLVLNGTLSNDEPLFYKQILTAYLTECFKNEHDLIIKNNTELLNCLIELVDNEIVHNLIIVPVGVYYEKPLPESKWKVFTRLILNLFKPMFGRVKVNFNQPFSLKEYLETQKIKFHQNDILLNSSCLKRHISYDAFQMNSIMCTNIVAFILINNSECNYVQLCSRFHDIKTDLSTNYQINFRYDSIRDIIDYSIDLLKEHLQITKTKNVRIIKPKQDSMLILFKLSKVIQQCYFMHSVLAHSIKKTLNSDYYHLNIKSFNRTPALDENNLILNSFQLIKIFQNEFETYKKPCETVFSKVFQTINLFINSKLILDQVNRNSNNKSFLNNYFSFDDDEEEDNYDSNVKKQNHIRDDIANLNPDINEINSWAPSQHSKLFKLKIDNKNITTLIDFEKNLSVYIESYLNFFNFLKTIDCSQSFSEKEFSDKLDQFTLDSIQTKRININKSILSYLNQNALKHSLKMNLIIKDKECYRLNQINELNAINSLLRKL